MLTLLHPASKLQSENRNFVQVTNVCTHHAHSTSNDGLYQNYRHVRLSQNQHRGYDIWPGMHAHRVSFRMTLDEQANRRHFVGIESFHCIRTSRIEKHAN